jgi:hypothetical protein
MSFVKETNQGQIWIEAAGTPAEMAEMREEAKEDESYRERLLNYISRLVTEATYA